MIPLLLALTCSDTINIPVKDTTLPKIYIRTENKDNKIKATINFDF